MGNSNSKRSKRTRKDNWQAKQNRVNQPQNSSWEASQRHISTAPAAPPSYNEVTNTDSGLGPTLRKTFIRDDSERQATNPEDHALQTLAKYDIATNALAKLVQKVAKYDDDGVDIYFLNSKQVRKDLNSSQAVYSFFHSVKPGGCTPIGARLDKIVGGYLTDAEATCRKYPDTYDEYMKPVVYVVITDGIPTDDPASVIETIAKRLDRNNFPISQVGIQFVQVGDDAGATKYLRSLDDDLPNLMGTRDIVDTTPYRGQSLDDETLIKIMLGGINKRIDRQEERR
ncbi:hypothetical protein BDQ17DRAFT_1549163 [Cyathus striatus]|nr:hypothetical protein BDQ17DRAFT_1549163 [Cyathus striatus]